MGAHIQSTTLINILNVSVCYINTVKDKILRILCTGAERASVKMYHLLTMTSLSNVKTTEILLLEDINIAEKISSTEMGLWKNSNKINNYLR